MGQRIRFLSLGLVAAFLWAPGLAQTRRAEDLRPRRGPFEIRSRQSVRKASRLGANLLSVVVKLDVASMASYRGGIAGLAATSPQATGEKRLRSGSPQAIAYRKFLESRTASFEAASRQLLPEAVVVHRLPVVVGGVSMLVPKDRLADLSRLPGVAGVYRDELLAPDTVRSPRFQGADVVWSMLGGQGKAGEGVIVANLDTGVWPELPSFSDPDPSGVPYPAPPAKWTGTDCDFGNTRWNPEDDPFACNHKLIGASRLMATYDIVVGLLPSEFRSARDDDGHGTHTLSIAGGNGGVLPSVTYDSPALPAISGVAPRAHVAAYRVCGSQGCFSSDVVAAIQQAILDGVDVINFSIAGGEDPYSDAVSLAFLDAYEAGVFVAAAAGNDGPGADTVAHREPWITTVAASTSESYFRGTLTLIGNRILRLFGTSVTGDVSGPVVLASDFDADGDPFCLAPFPTGTWRNGEIVVCARGTSPRVDKGQNVAAGGAAGMILYNPELADLGQDQHHLPAIHVNGPAGATLLTFLKRQNAPVMGMFTQGVLANVGSRRGRPPPLFPGTAGGADVIASFSSRGGAAQTLGISKPDVAATGVAILAGGTPKPNDSGATTSFGAPGEYMFVSGTSMSSPHVAGAAALLKDLHPGWTPWQTKSALMLTAKTEGVKKENGATPADPFDRGSGRIDLRQAGTPGLTLVSPTRAEFEGLANELWRLNYPSLYLPAHPGRTVVERTFRSENERLSFWWASVSSPADLQVEVEPRNFLLGPGRELRIAIAVDSREVPIDDVRHATLHLESFDHRLDFPITIVKKEGPFELSKTCDPAVLAIDEETECIVTITNTGLERARLSFRDVIPPELRVVGPVTGASGTEVLTFNGALDGGKPADVQARVDALASPGGYVPLAGFSGTLDVGASDESIANVVDVPRFDFAGRGYDTIGVVSNGYLVVGGGGPQDVTFLNTDFPDPGRPNHVLAPCWTDLDPGAGGKVLVNVLTDGFDDWTVVEWDRVPNFNDGRLNTCQIWIGSNADENPEEDISFVYGPEISNGDLGFLTVGVENEVGNRGEAVYFDGRGTPPGPSSPNGTYEVDVFSTPGAPGESHVVRFRALGVSRGKWTNCAEVESELTSGTKIACVEGEVRRRRN